MDTTHPFCSMSREELLRALEMFAKNWLAHDGCWFLAAEEQFGMETAIILDGFSWKRFAAAEAAVDALDAASLAESRAITVPLARQVLTRLAGHGPG